MPNTLASRMKEEERELMGIRVHKLIGYGIADLRVGDDGFPDDPRWDYAAYRERWRNPDREETLQDFIAWIQEEENARRIIDSARREGWSFRRPDAPTFDESVELRLMVMALEDRAKKKGSAGYWIAPYSAVRWDGEFGDAGVVLFQCPEHPDWSRYDDIIDYYEEEVGTRVTFLDGRTGIWPYDGHMRRFREPSPEVAAKLSEMTGVMQAFAPEPYRDLDGAEIPALGGGEYNQLVGRWDEQMGPLIKDEDVLRHLKEDWRPKVPIGILAMMEYVGCFPDIGEGSMVNSLRPMVYVYWG